MGFSRPDFDDEAEWQKARRRFEERAEAELSEEDLYGEEVDEDEEEAQEETLDLESEPAPRRRPETRRARSRSRTPVAPLGRVASPEVASERLPQIKKSAERVRRMKKVAIDPSKHYRVGKVVFDPTVQKFGEVVYSAPGYVRIRMRDGTETTHGKPPLEDRKNFVFANFERMDNKTMAEILGISVHTMRRLCHEYGLKRHPKGGKKAAAGGE